MQIFAPIICFITQNPYLCIVFFMVLDLRLMKIGSLGRFPFLFYLFWYPKMVLDQFGYRVLYKNS